ncbi:MAG TPA: LacI family DNA-binding transcriptional regulator [Bacteroidales bacterium]|nr:LacI family DNA-binding transcriptional regulator [Bacteroidales bacterium]
MEKVHVSLKDLAKELKISISSVSRALKNHPDISPELAQKVQELARQKNYKPNPYAIRLLKHESKTIGIVIPDIVTYFYASVISGIESYTKEKGYSIVISSSQESYQKEQNIIENLLNLRVDGLIVCLSQETADYKHFDKILEDNTPLVFFDRVCRTSEISSVVADNFEAARNVTRHFYENGCTRIAFINGPNHLNISKERLAGYIEGLKDCGLKISNDLLASCNMTPEGAKVATQKLLALKVKPDAILSINDTVAFSAMKEVKRRGYKIPDDIAFVGFTDEFHASIVDPELTSVMHPTFEMGQEAARLLINQLESKTPGTPRQVVMKTTLVVRDSSIKKQKK